MNTKATTKKTPPAELELSQRNSPELSETKPEKIDRRKLATPEVLKKLEAARKKRSENFEEKRKLGLPVMKKKGVPQPLTNEQKMYLDAILAAENKQLVDVKEQSKNDDLRKQLNDDMSLIIQRNNEMMFQMLRETSEPKPEPVTPQVTPKQEPKQETTKEKISSNSSSSSRYNLSNLW